MKNLLYRIIYIITKPLLYVFVRLITMHGDNARLFLYFQHQGYAFLKEHYYLPFPVGNEIPLALNAPKSGLVGLNLHTSFSSDLLDTIYPRYRAEFTTWLENVESKKLFHIYNGTYMAVDSEVYYTMIREFKPKTIIEIGSGKSTIVAAAAVEKNLSIDRTNTQLISIEPYPNDIVSTGIAKIHGLNRLIPTMVQDVDIKLFSELGKNDILFIDSTHVLKQGGDVQYIYNEIIPRLRPGVFVHVHDISLPNPYPKVYFDQHFYWNEQFILQALLTHNPHYTVMWPGTYMALTQKDKLLRTFPTLAGMYDAFPQSNPSSFWFRIT